MGCASSQAAGQIPAVMDNHNKTENSNVPVKYPPAEAFEIPLNDNTLQSSDSTTNTDGGDSSSTGGNKIDSLIKKHPPKRLQRLLLEQNIITPTTIEDLEEKLAKAEIRRQQYLQQKVDTVLTLAQPLNKQDNDNDIITENSRSPGDGFEQIEKEQENT